MAWKYKYTQYLNGTYHGASESYHLDIAPEPLKDLLDNLKPLLQKRAAMLNQGWKTHSHEIVVVQDDAGNPVPREGLPNYLNYVSGSPRPALPEDTDIKYRMFGSGLFENKYRFINFAGGPKAALSSDDGFSNDPIWIASAVAFFKELVKFAPGWFKRTRSDPVPVVGYEMDSVGVVRVDLAAVLPGAAAGGKPFRVRISGVNGLSELNGEWTAYQYQAPGAGATAASFLLKTRIGLWGYQSPGEVTTYSPQWVAAGTENTGDGTVPIVDVWGGGKRQHGPPFGISPGRDPARRRG